MCRYTWHKKGEKEVGVMGKDSKEGMPVLVTGTADATMLPFQLITDGMTHQDLVKFVWRQQQTKCFTTKAGGDHNPGATVSSNTNGHTKKNADPKAKDLAEYPPYFKDEGTGHIICADTVLLSH